MKINRVEKVSLALAITACLTGSVTAATTLSKSSEPDFNSTEQGVFVSKYYHEDGDYTSMLIETADGDTIEVSDYVAPLQDSCELLYDEDGNLVGLRAFHSVTTSDSAKEG